MDHNLRRERLASRLPDTGADAFLITFLPNVRYLTGYSGSNGQVLVTGHGSIFFTDGRYEEQSRREVPDVERVIYSDGFKETLVEACSKLDAKRVAFEEAAVSYKTFRELTAKLDLVPAGDEVGKLRWVKDPDEMSKIQKAQDITDAAFAAVVPTLAEGQTEVQVARALQKVMEDNGAEGLAFETIAAFGESAAEPHHSPTERTLRRGDIVKLDFGARWDGYHSDFTRTAAVGDPGERIRGIYDVVRESQQAGIDAVKAGIEGSEADAASRKVIEDAGFGELFGHGLGHGVGLEIHEGPTLSRTSHDVLPVGSVVTVEPGVYVPELGGVRIEDMVEVLTDGCRPMPSSTKELIIL